MKTTIRLKVSSDPSTGRKLGLCGSWALPTPRGEPRFGVDRDVLSATGTLVTPIASEPGMSV